MKTTTRTLLAWEFKWIPVEMVIVAMGLVLLLGLRLDEAGAWFLFGALAISMVVRLTHYRRFYKAAGA